MKTTEIGNSLNIQQTNPNNRIHKTKVEHETEKSANDNEGISLSISLKAIEEFNKEGRNISLQITAPEKNKTSDTENSTAPFTIIQKAIKIYNDIKDIVS